MIEFGTVANISAAERLLSRLQEASATSDILVPTNLSGYQFGGLAALIQVLITWSKKEPARRLFTYISSEADISPRLQRFISVDHGIVAVLLASDVLMRNGDRSVKKIADQLVRDRISHEMNWADVPHAGRGPKSFLLCADETGKAFLPALYYQTAESVQQPSVKSVSDFVTLAEVLLERTANFGTVSRKRLPDISRPLGTILHELFENTHFWARSDCQGHVIRRSVRGIRFELYRGSIDDFLRFASDCPPLLSYLAHQQSLRKTVGRGFVEISVFDSGPGLAPRILGRCLQAEDTVDAEYEAIRQCLKLHSTTSLHGHRGLGLHTVLRMLTAAGGFLRVRTGRLSMTRDFVNNPYEPTLAAVEPYLHDWETRSIKITSFSRVEGTLLTMLIPVRVPA